MPGLFCFGNIVIMKNKSLLLLILFSVIIGVFFYFWLARDNHSASLSEDQEKQEEQLFNIILPDDFNEYELAKVDEQLEILKEIYAEDKEDIIFWIGLGNLKSFVRDYQGAISAYEKCLEIDSSDILVNTNMADVYEKKLENFPKAEEYYMKAIDNQSNNPDLYNRLARLYYLKMNKPAEAEKTFLEGLEKTNNYPDLLVGLINFYDRQERTEDKIKYIRILLDAYPDNEIYQQKYSKFIK